VPVIIAREKFMERPSHLSLLMPHSHSGRMTRLALAAGVPVLALWGLTHGMGGAVLQLVPPDLHARVLDKEIVKPVPPPNIPKLEKPIPLKDVPPQFVIETPRDAGTITATTTTVVAPQNPVTPQVGESRGAIGVTVTHTRPPYPLLARRQGQEGKVTLRLTIQADGHVGKAEIAQSSGSEILDSAAVGWIMAHWLYKPALQNGQAVASQATAAVTFSLDDQR
jgi:protein TonB